MEDKIYEMARKRVAEKKGFYRHFSVYLAVGAFFFIMNVLTYYDSYEWWFFFPMIPWGAAMAIHYFSVFGLPGGHLSREWEEKELRREMDRIRSKSHLLEAPKQGDQLELRPLKKEKSGNHKRWDEEDLV